MKRLQHPQLLQKILKVNSQKLTTSLLRKQYLIYVSFQTLQMTKQPLKPLLSIAVTLLPMKYKLNGSNDMTSLYIQLQTKVGFVQYAKITAQVNTGAQKQ